MTTDETGHVSPDAGASEEIEFDEHGNVTTEGFKVEKVFPTITDEYATRERAVEALERSEEFSHPWAGRWRMLDYCDMGQKWDFAHPEPVDSDP